MPAAQGQGIRKGTKSCTECRRRKIRCIQSYEDAETCRRCEERGLKCIAQTHSSGSSVSQKMSSKNRIAKLELKVLSLTETIRAMQNKPSPQGVQNKEVHYQSSEGNDLGSGFRASEYHAEQPFHLRLLFQNDWLSVKGPSESERLQWDETRSISCLLNGARNLLQMLIPSKTEISDYIDSASDWFPVLNSFFPIPSVAKCGKEIIASYEEMHSTTVDAIKLASWLLNIVLVAEQLLPEQKSMESRQNKQATNPRSSAISAAVEESILAHDMLTGSVQGISLFIQFIRIEIGRGNFHKAWLKLRRTIAIAELMGLHNVAQVVQVETATEAAEVQSKVQLWDLICASDRLLGMMLNLPPITGCHEREMRSYPVSINGIVQTHVYLYRLTNIAIKVQHLDALSISNGPTAEGYQHALELSGDLMTLASQTPETWWSSDRNDGKPGYPEHLVQFLHHYLAMRIHLPLTLRQGFDGENIVGLLACIDAGESMLERYLFLCNRLPPGLFLSELLDLQAFSAAVTLLLISQMTSNVGIDKTKIANQVREVTDLLHEKRHGASGSKTAQDGFSALCSMRDLLQGKNSHSRGMVFHAPLLGYLHVCRNGGLLQPDNDWSSELMLALGLNSESWQLPFSDFDTSMSIWSSLGPGEQWDGNTGMS